MPPPEPSAPAKPSPSLQRAARLIWIVVGIIVVMVVIASVFGSKEQDEQAATAPTLATTPVPAAVAKPKPPVTPMAASIDGFEQAIPLLKQRGHKAKVVAGVTSYSWSDLSVSGHKNFLTLRDADGDGVPERGVAGVTMLKDDQPSQGEALVLAYKVVATASGEALTADQFSSWFIAAMAGKDVTRRFGNVIVTIDRVDAGNGSLFTIGLNE